MPVEYAELHALSNFTFLRGASRPEELVEAAAKLGYEALAITDECSMSGIVRAHSAARKFGLKKQIIGSEFRLQSGRKIVALARNRNGYASLCQLISTARRAAEKGSYTLVDSRPTPGYMKGHIPTAISIPFPKMKEMMAKLPKEKDQLVIFYCQGYR